MIKPLMTQEVRLVSDVVATRQRARQIAGLLGFSALDQTRIATASSEVARNAHEYAGGGRVEFLIDDGPPVGLLIRLRERGPGIRDLQSLLDGQQAAAAEPRTGLEGAKRLMDRFEADSSAAGAMTITMAKFLGPRQEPFSSEELARVSAELARRSPSGLLEELQAQNQELLRTLELLRTSQEQLTEIHTRELEETNRGVVALYAELDENAKALKRISDLKSRFLSNMSHEFRSPLNSIMSLTGFLLDRTDGELTPEQDKQVHFIRKAAEGLSTLVNDLLDLAKVEAGKAVVRVEPFEVAGLFHNLRGMVRPLLGQSTVSLLFEEPVGIPPLYTDEGKLSQILRNFLANAIKFTERGEIRVAAAPGPGDTVTFSVADTGIGIAPEHQELIFEEFGQVEVPLQQKSKGTGLGLPLARKLAELLGGFVAVKSESGAGSTFFVEIPRIFHDSDDQAFASDPLPLDPARHPILIVEDDSAAIFLYDKYLEGTRFQPLLARTLGEARRVLEHVRPAAVILDIILEAENGWTLLRELKSDPRTKEIPAFVLTVVEGRERALALGADEFCAKPVAKTWFLERVRALVPLKELRKILIIDDSETDRYALRDCLNGTGRLVILEAASMDDAVIRAVNEQPDLIFLDLVMPDAPGMQILERLKAADQTKQIPVIINTSRTLSDEERKQLKRNAVAILSKQQASRDDARAGVRDTLERAGFRPASQDSRP